MSRRAMRSRLAACLFGLSVGIAHARFVVEQGGLHVKFPKSAAKAHKHGFDMSLANFGSPKYGGELTGRLVYVEKDHKHTNVCNPPCNYACQNFSQAVPPFKPPYSDYIMLVDRGPLEDDMQPCKFAEKVLNAQRAGAHAVLVVNYEDKHTTMEAPDDRDEASYTYLHEITIPAAFITKSDGQVLKDLLKPGMEEVHIVLDWKDVLPRAQKVEWEFWTNSNNQCGAVCDAQKEFIREFVPVARELEDANLTAFTPHYIVWVCPPPYRSSDDCQSQCIHSGRYCTPDPDGDLEVGYSGKDIVAENLRQLCVFDLASKSNPPRPWVWWDYVTKFGEECRMDDNNYTEECAERVFNEVGGTQWSSMAGLRECIGNTTQDRTNPIMEAEMKRQKGGGDVGEVYIMPTIRINNGQYRGKVKYTEVLHAICAGFTKGMEPPACRNVDDSCRTGSEGQKTCSMSQEGKTKCVNTLGGYECTCGPGFTSHLDNGKEKCLDINECLIAEARDLDPKCNCERCACKDIYGSYECISDIPDECAANHGGCWHDEFMVGGQRKTFSACKDNLAAYQDAAARKLPLDKVKLHECVCPPCFTEFNKGKGPDGHDIVECVPKCDLEQCDEPTGICMAGGGGGRQGLGAWAVVLIVLACLTVLAGGVFGLYKWRLRNAMHQEIRAIMAQYMPLESTEAQTTSTFQIHDSVTNGKAPATPETPEKV